MKNLIYTIALTMLSAYSVLAQPGWNWCDDKATAEEKNVLYTDAVKMGDYKSAVVPLQWLITTCPGLNKSLYQNGAKIYNKLASAEKDKSKKAELVDSLMWMYDMRIKYFGDEPNVINRKAFAAYKFYINDRTKAKMLLDMFDRAFEIGGSKILDQNLLAYMNVIRVHKKVTKDISDEEILKRYDKIVSVAEEKIKAAKARNKSAEKIIKQKDLVDKMLTEIVTIDCDFVINTLGPKFKQSPNDVTLVKRMFSFMLTGKCTDDPMFLEVAKQLQTLEPDYGLSMVIGKKCMANKNWDCAESSFQEALKLTEDGTAKSETLVLLGKLRQRENQKSTARKFYRDAIAADPSNKEAYSLIGDLYMSSFADCKKEEDMVKDRLVFIAAYNMYKKAGDVSKMQTAKSQFPSTEEIFTNNYEKGQAMGIGCWINETVVLSSRD